MKRHKKEEDYKAYLKLRQRESEVWEAKRNLGYIELDEPIPNGYTARLVLRDDIARREDANIFQWIVDNLGTTEWSKYANFESKRRGQVVKHSLPHLKTIYQGQYENLPTSIQKWFKEGEVGRWSGQSYYCTVPSFFFTILIERDYITKVKIHDELLEQELSEIRDEIYTKYYKYAFGYRSGAPKDFVKPYNRSFRRQCKNILHRIVTQDKNLEFNKPGRNSAAWDYW